MEIFLLSLPNRVIKKPFYKMFRALIVACFLLCSALSSFAQESGSGRANYEVPTLNETVFAIRTNLLLPALNVGAELPVGERWSIGADYYYPWLWPSKKNKNCFEMLGWSVEGRYWFGKNRKAEKRLLGHSLALYGAGGYFDFEKDYTGKQGEFISGGLDYTYALALGKRGRVNMEFTIAVGYIHSNSRKYNVHSEGGPLLKEDGDILFDYVGPTKAAISLVIPIRKKEGKK